MHFGSRERGGLKRLERRYIADVAAYRCDVLTRNDTSQRVESAADNRSLPMTLLRPCAPCRATRARVTKARNDTSLLVLLRAGPTTAISWGCALL